MKPIFLLTMLLLGPVFALAATQEARGPVRPGRTTTLDVASPYMDNRVQDAGNVRVNFTNWGRFGNEGMYQNEALPDPCTGEWAPEMEFPAGSEVQYLWQAGLWVGAEVGDESLMERRVSTATDGWQWPALLEFWPGEGNTHGIRERSNIPGAVNCRGEAIYDPAARANQELIATYTDTLTDAAWVGTDDVDGSHRPLGLKVQQTSLAWSSPAFSEFILLEYVLTNISGTALQNVYLGMYTDADVGPANLSQQHTDDITGFLEMDTLRHDTANIAWIADNDGWDPESPGGPLLAPHVMGVQLLATPQQNLKLSYNWWVSFFVWNLDYGPAWASVGGHSGTPVGDAQRYAALSNGERDFDQNYVSDAAWRAAHPQTYRDPCTGATAVHPWSSQNSVEMDGIAVGYDTRFLLSCGPLGVFDHMAGTECIYKLQPGATCTLTVALLTGRDFHDAAHPQTPGSPVLNPALFHFAGLLQTSRAARTLFRSHYTYQPPVAPMNFRPVSSAASTVTLVWQHPALGTHAGYRLYQISSLTPGTVTPLNTTPLTGTTLTATGLGLGSEWRFAIETLDDSGLVSAQADTLVRVGACLPVTGLQAVRDNAAVHVSWTASDDPATTSYRVLRRSSLSGAWVVFTTEAPEYFDADVVSGRRYEYFVITDNNRGVPSYAAGPAVVVPWGPQRRILVIDETDPTQMMPSPLGEFPNGSVDSLYARLLTGCGEAFDTLQQLSNLEPRFTLESLAQYDLVIWHSEDMTLRTPSPVNIQSRERILRDYVLAGGRLLRAARDYGHNLGPFSGTVNGSALDDGTSSALQFDSLRASGRYDPQLPLPVPRFIGATPVLAGFPMVRVDSARLATLTFGSQHVNFMPEVDFFWPRGNTQPLYRAELLPEDTTGMANQPCGVSGMTEIVLGFPLYCLHEDDAQALMCACLGMLRSLDVPHEPGQTPVPASTRLRQNYPNPFNPSTEIVFDLPQAARVELAVYNLLGQRVATLVDEVRIAGTHRVLWNGRDAAGQEMASGLYFCRLQSGEFVESRKMMLLR